MIEYFWLYEETSGYVSGVYTQKEKDNSCNRNDPEAWMRFMSWSDACLRMEQWNNAVKAEREN